jgi:uncharacterized membrane protein
VGSGILLPHSLSSFPVPHSPFPVPLSVPHFPNDGVVLAHWPGMEQQLDPFTPDATGTPVADLSGADAELAGADDRLDRRRRRVVVNRAFGAIKTQHAAERTWMETLAERLNAAASSTPFLVTHALWFTGWILLNTGLLGLEPFDPFPFGLLTMIVSLEAIFLTIFVLMAQKRDSAIAELREEMSLQVALRLEEEVTKTLQLVAGLYTRLGHKVGEDPELHEMLQPLDIARIERELVLQIATARQPKRLDD